MALIPSAMRALGTTATAFALPDVVTGRVVQSEEFRRMDAFLVIFMCAHCPYVRHVEKEIANIGLDFAEENLGIVAISSNFADQYPDDAPEKLKEQALRLGFNFPYLYDESQEIARGYGAACTPDFFLFDSDMKLAYRGQLDGSRPGNNVPVNGKDLRFAINALLAGRIPPEENQKPSIGCNIKWKPR